MSENKNLRKILRERLLDVKIDLTELAQEKIVQYLELLDKWNTVHNLTAIRDPFSMIDRHILDSLSLRSFILGNPSSSILDIGTGAGLPGIPLAITCPNLSFILLDSQQKKINFVEHVILSLKLSNVLTACTRVEVYHPEKRFDWVVSRAFASLAVFVRVAGPLCEEGGKLIAMKGDIDEAELAALPEGYTIEQIQPIVIPGIEKVRSLVFVTPNEKRKV